MSASAVAKHVQKVKPAQKVKTEQQPSKPDWHGMVVVDQGRIRAFLRGDLIMLDNYRRYRLINILIPPYEDPVAAEALRKKFLGGYVTVYAYPAPDDMSHIAQDRYGIPLTHVVTRKGVWLQQYLVANGYAHAYHSSAGSRMLAALQRAEDRASKAGAGLWQGSANGIKVPDQVKDFIGSYQIVRGRVTSVRFSKSDSAIFFNFGEDIPTCFSAVMSGDITMWYTQGDPRYAEKVTDWAGRNVELRGWIVEENNKPVMHITNRDQINVLP